MLTDGYDAALDADNDGILAVTPDHLLQPPPSLTIGLELDEPLVDH